MKWPASVVMVRHGQSAYNVLKETKEADPLYQEFKHLYETDFFALRTRELAQYIRQKYSLKVSDSQTPLTEKGHVQARTTGERLKDIIELPHIVFVSPYLRTQQTLEELVLMWPQLGKVRTVVDDRIREREHGLATLYNDWRVFHVFHPEQKEYYELEISGGPFTYQYPQGESIMNVRDRDRAFRGMLIREHSGKRILMVTHHETILTSRANGERWGVDEYLDTDENQKHINCGVTIYKGCPASGKDGQLKLQDYNLKLY